MKTPRFTAADATLLESFLAAPQRPKGTFTYCEVAGFLFAVACSPDLVMPSEWMPVIFNDEEARPSTLAEAQQVFPALMLLYNQINDGVLKGKPRLPLRCKPLSGPAANLAPTAPLSGWARGFSAGSEWLEETWEEYSTRNLDRKLASMIDEEIGTAMMVLSFFSSRKLAAAYQKEIKRRDVSLEVLAGEMLGLVPDAMRSYALIGRGLGEADASGKNG